MKLVERPAVIVLALAPGARLERRGVAGAGSSSGAAPLDAEVLALTLRHAVMSDLPVTVVTTEALATVARLQVAARDVLVLSAGPVSSAVGRAIAAGIIGRPVADGWLLLPGDMFAVTPETLREVAGAIKQQTVVVASHKGRRGHPVGFSAELYSELSRLTTDEGARRLLARYPAHEVEVEDPAVLTGPSLLVDRKSGAQALSVPGALAG